MYDMDKVDRSLEESKKLLAKEPEKLDQKLEIKKEIRFQKVHFAYPTAHEGAPDTLQGVSFRVKAGTSTAIVGPSGSGKSTLVQLLMRLYDPSKGEIFIDETNIKDFPLSTLRNTIGYVP
jgi:ABC-type multidrug transport system fused ATPase/permease subunit